MVVVAGTLKGSTASKLELFIITLITGTPVLFQSARRGSTPIPGRNCFSGLSVMRGEEGEVILERARILLA